MWIYIGTILVLTVSCSEATEAAHTFKYFCENWPTIFTDKPSKQKQKHYLIAAFICNLDAIDILPAGSVCILEIECQ